MPRIGVDIRMFTFTFSPSVGAVGSCVLEVVVAVALGVAATRGVRVIGRAKRNAEPSDCSSVTYLIATVASCPGARLPTFSLNESFLPISFLLVSRFCVFSFSLVRSFSFFFLSYLFQVKMRCGRMRLNRRTVRMPPLSLYILPSLFCHQP